MRKKMNIAICEDAADDARLLSELLKSSGLYCDIEYFPDAESFLAKASISELDLLLFDVYLPGMSGIELAQKVRAIGCDCEIAFITVSEISTGWKETFT